MSSMCFGSVMTTCHPAGVGTLKIRPGHCGQVTELDHITALLDEDYAHLSLPSFHNSVRIFYVFECVDERKDGQARTNCWELS